MASSPDGGAAYDTCTDSRNLSFYVGVKVNAVGVKVKVAAQWLWGVKVNMGG